MNQNERKTVMRRMVLLIAVAALVMGLYALRLIFLQLVNGDEYKSQATNTTDITLRSPLPRRHRGQHRQAHCHHDHQLQRGAQQAADG